mgnify:CR=1 FL=1
MKQCQTCGKEMPGLIGGFKYCSDECKPSHVCLGCGEKFIPKATNRKGEPLDMDRPTIDHVVPIHYGGTHTKDNVKACCFGCNTNKGVMSVDEFRMSTERVNEVMAAQQNMQ